MHPSSAPAAGTLASGILEIDDFGQAPEKHVHSFTQGAGAFAVDNTDAANPVSEALAKVFRQQFADLRGSKRVKIELRCDRDTVGFVVHLRMMAK
jgi:hypothetical protein